MIEEAIPQEDAGKKFFMLIVSLILLVSVASSFGAVVDKDGEWWIYLEGTEVAEEQAREYPYFMEAYSDYSGACVFNGSIYRQGYMRDIGKRIGFGGDTLLFEKGGWYGDYEICLNTGVGDHNVSGGKSNSDDYLGQDWGGEWQDVDRNRVTEYLRNQGSGLASDYWKKYWVTASDGLEVNADPSTWNSSFPKGPGMAVEDDCVSYDGGCEDIMNGTGYQRPFWANYSEGGGEDDNMYVGHTKIFNGLSGGLFSFLSGIPNNHLANVHNRVQAGDMDGDDDYTGHGEGNSQDNEPTSLSLAWDENSHIDQKDDEWALTPSLDFAIAYNGTPFKSGQCYGAPRVQGVRKTKDQAVYANSYALGVNDTYKGELSSGLEDGTWVNPDDTERSITRGNFTCDLTGNDWGFGYGDSSYENLTCRVPGSPGCSKEGYPASPGDEAYDPTKPHAISGKFNFDYNSDPAGYPQDNKQQWPEACGDDKNEFLVREHAATYGGEENPEFEGRNDFYACVDRPSDCVLQGEIYSAGQLVDVSGAGANTGETGVDSDDQEICADLDNSIPGGEWYDADNETLRSWLIGGGSGTNPDYYVRYQDPVPTEPHRPMWHNGTVNQPNGAHEADISPYNPVNFETGYALEDDCDPELDIPNEGCDDSGLDENLGTAPETPGGLVYSPFKEEMYADDPNVFNGFAVRMYVGYANGTAYKQHGKSNAQDEENVPGDIFKADKYGGGTWPTENLNDSTINQLEDTWAISNYSYHAVGPTGKIWTNGSCYGVNPWKTGGLDAVDKDMKVVGNSFALAMQVSASDPNKEGVWVNPDSTPKTTLTGGLSCDLNSTDWGVGYNNGSGLLVTNNDSTVTYTQGDGHVATGNIAFDINSDPNGVGASRNLKQYPNACGDDRNEYLIREHNDSIGDTEQLPNLGRSNIYVCADRISDCAYHGGVYSEGQLVDVSNAAVDEESGVDSVDEEVCVDADKRVPGGEWYDVDNETLNAFLKGDPSNYNEDQPSTYSGLVRENATYSGPGVRWFTDNYPPANETQVSPYNPLDYSDGYALEDDCAANVEYCEDSGPDETHFEPGAVYSYFVEARKADDENVFEGRSVRMYVGYANGTAYYKHGKSNSQDEENTDDTVFDSTINGWPTEGLNDSTVDPLEDTWAISGNLSKPVGPTGRVWDTGQCYGNNPWKDGAVDWVNKNYKVVGNSYAMAVDVNGYPKNKDKGVWVNPDSTPKSALKGVTSCDLNTTDWGYGFNTDGIIQYSFNCEGYSPEADEFKLCDRQTKDVNINGDMITLNLVGTGTYADGTVYASVVNEETATTHTITDDPQTGSTTINGRNIKLSKIDGTDGNTDEETEVVLEKVGVGDSTGLTVVKGDARQNGYDGNPHVVNGPITFDMNSDPKGKGEEHNLKQYPGACGDDKQEFLIREHRSFPDESEHNASLERDNIYVCADRPTDCAYDGGVYSMGQARDVSGTDEELGVNSEDAEICADTNPNIPGGEWQDPDNASIQYHIVGTGKYGNGVMEQPGTYKGFPTFVNASGGVHWFNTSWGDNSNKQRPIHEANLTEYSPVNWTAGYAFEDDCGEWVDWCEDSGKYENHSQGKAVYSPFIEGSLNKADDGSVGDGYVVRTYMGGCAQHGCYNTQQFENVYADLPTLNDSTIQADEDTWAISSKPYYGVGPTGKVYKNGSCYGTPNPEFKGATVVANSYVYAHDADGDGDKEGDWVDPDNFEQSVLKGQESCQVSNLTDWGLGYNKCDGSGLEVAQGRAWKRGYNNTNDWKYHIVSGCIAFDNFTDAGVMDQREEKQYKDACGDDQNEHLIREHTSNATADEHVPLLDKNGRQNIYGCTDRISDCVFNGKVYSEGQLVDIGAVGNETGDNSTDMDVCIDSDERIPGGEWHDIDNTTWRNYLTGESNASWTFTEDDPSTYKRLVANSSALENYWFTDRNQHALEVEITPFNPLNYSDGYALEDDCDPDLDYCTDLGAGRQFMPGHSVYSTFIEDSGEDDSDILNGKAVRLWVGYANGTAWPDHYATNKQSEENAGDLNFSIGVGEWVPGDTTIDLNDSTIQPREDTWALADNVNDVVGPTGKLYEPGMCYGSNASTIMETWVKKNETVMANSFAYSMEANSDGNEEGVWINPDSTPLSLTQGNFSCDLNTTDWGIGYNNGVNGRNQDSDGNLVVHHGDARSIGYEVDDIHAVSGPITFDTQSDPPGIIQDNKPQYPSACGDDGYEFLIREHRTTMGGQEYKSDIQSRDNIYVCADRQTDCAYNGYVFTQGDTIDISRLAPTGEDPERGEDIRDEEICVDLDKSIPGGEWYDKDSNWTVRSKIMEINVSDMYSSGSSNPDSCTYDLYGQVSGQSKQGEVLIDDESKVINANGSFKVDDATIKCGSTQLIKYRENGDVLRTKRIALPGSGGTIENVEINVNAAFDPLHIWNQIEANQDHDFGYNPGTDWKNRTYKLKRKELGYFNSTGSYTAVYNSYKPKGYATEDDCGRLMRRSGTGPCGDVGTDVQDNEWIASGNFSYNAPTSLEGAKQDNFDIVNYDYHGYHNRIDDSSNQLEPGAETERNWNLSDVYGVGYKIYDSRDTTEGPDKWALTRFKNYSIDNRGRGYPPGTADRKGCYYKPGITPRTDIDNQTVKKRLKVFGNSFANASDYDNDGNVEGVWEDPDEIPPTYSNFSCDLTGPDKGYGYDTGPNDGKFHYENGKRSSHVVIGDIAFATVEGKAGSFAQEPPACGDDSKEYVIEELGAAHNSLEYTGRWGCGTDYDDCVSRAGGEYAIYRSGDLVNTEEAVEDFGRAKNDKEICEQKPSDKYGVWYDQDYNQDYCQENNLYGQIGVRWINESYIDTHTYSVLEGIDDDLNPYLHNQGESVITSTQGDPDYNSGETPVPTGKYVNGSIDRYFTNYNTWTRPDDYRNLTATKGFCAGDDIGETVIVQKSSTTLIRTNYSVLAVANSPDDCVLDAANYPKINGDKRRIYSSGENVTLNFDGSTRTASCYGGRWYANWPVVFLQDKVEVEQGTRKDITFKIINVEDERTTYEVNLYPGNDIESYTSFNSFDGTFNASVPAQSSRQFSIEVYGADPALGPENIQVGATSLDSSISGTDNVTADVVEQVKDESEADPSASEVPGIGVIQMLVLMLLAGVIYYTRILGGGIRQK